MPNYDYFFAFFWGPAVLGAFIGYGRLVSHICSWEKKESLGWGMQSALDAKNFPSISPDLRASVRVRSNFFALLFAPDRMKFHWLDRHNA